MSRSKTVQSNMLGIGFALTAASFYGCVPNFARAAFGNGVPAIETVLMRTTVIALVLGLVGLMRGESFRISKQAWPSFFGQVVATFFVSASYLASVQFIPVGLAVIIFFAFPIIIVVVAPLVEGKAPSIARLSVAVLAFIGLGIAVGPGLENLDLRGVGLAAVAAIGCALQFFSGRSLGQYLQPAAFGSLVHYAIWPLVAAIALYGGSGSLQLLSGTPSPLAFMFVGGVCLTYLAGYFLHMSSLKVAPASTVAPFFNLEPIVTTVISTVFFGEALKPNQYGGGALVLAALLLASHFGKRKDAA
jgi:drug/metabolite transporter (DMT)-like permease